MRVKDDNWDSFIISDRHNDFVEYMFFENKLIELIFSLLKKVNFMKTEKVKSYH